MMRVQDHEDKSKSGANLERGDLKRMTEDIEAMRPCAVVVTKIDRYARSLIDIHNSIQGLEQIGVGFISAQDSDIDTPSTNGRLLLQILGAIAEFERTMINSRTSAGMAMAEGVKFGRPTLKTSKFNGENILIPRR